MPRWLLLLFVSFTLFATACASAPRETVTLSETIAQQTASLQSAHEALVSRYYAEMRNRVDEFLKDVWIPTFLAKAVNNAKVQDQMTSTLAAANLNTDVVLAKINADSSLTAPEKAAIANAIGKAKIEGRAQFGQMMIKFSEEATRQIGIERKQLIAPIDEQEQLVLDKIRTSYSTLQAEQATIKAFLASAVAVQQQQEEVLQRLNLLDARNKALNTALSLSDQAGTALTTVQQLEAGSDQSSAGESQAAKFLEAIRNINNSLRAGTPAGKEGDKP